MKYSKEDLIEKYQQIKLKLGKQPSSVDFYRESGISQNQLKKIYPRGGYSNLVIECNDSPNTFSTEKIGLENILVQWGNLVKKDNRIPVITEWDFNKCKPTSSQLYRGYNLLWSEIPYKFLEFAAGKEEWKDIVNLIPARNEESISIETIQQKNVQINNLDFIPPILHDFLDLSVNKEKFLAFEKKVNLLFQMLGFEVADFGQGTGRNPDGIAKAREFHFAIIIDAKSREENYKIGTEDRKFIEYIKTHSEALKRDGISKVYFLVVSSQFDGDSIKAINNMKLETGVTLSLITSELLLKLLGSKIEKPRLFDLKKLETLLIKGGQITQVEINKFLSIGR